MPSPKPNETQKEFHSRCMSVLVGDEGKPQDQANAICFSIWDDSKKKECVQEFVQNKISVEELIDKFLKVKSKED